MQNVAQHILKLRKVFEKLDKYLIQLEPKKCEFLKTEWQYLGHDIAEQGICPDEKKVEAIKLFQTPNCSKNLKSFLGLAGYYIYCKIQSYLCTAN